MRSVHISAGTAIVVGCCVRSCSTDLIQTNSEELAAIVGLKTMPVFQFIWEIRSAHKRELYVFWLSQIRVPKTVRFKASQPVLLLYQFDTIESTGFSVFAYGNLTDLYGKATPQIEVIYSLKFTEKR